MILLTQHARQTGKYALTVFVIWAGLNVPAALSRADEAIRFATPGVKLAGNQFLYDSGFELLDFNGDGKLDVFLPNSSMMAFSVHINEGTRERPEFGHAVGYPVNFTEAHPQCIEHNQIFAVCDLNGDGLFDLIVFDGQLRYLPNAGTPRGPNHWHLHKSPQFFPGSDTMIRENARFATGPESLFWRQGIFARAVLTLTVADWDGDGLDDLLICRTKGEAPGVKPTGGAEQWTGNGRVLITKPANPLPGPAEPTFLGKLQVAPARGLYFYRNVGTKAKPWFDKGLEIVTEGGKSIAAPNPLVADVDGDGVLDLLSTETEFTSNGYRVDWPTEPHVRYWRRARKEDVAVLQPTRPLADAAGTPIPAGVQVRLADMRGLGSKELLVMDGGLKGTIRRYPNSAAPGKPMTFGPPTLLRGKDFLRFDYMYQPIVVNWFGPNSRDLVLVGGNEAHCAYALRRVGLFKNVATKVGEVRYEPAGLFNYQGDLGLVSRDLEEQRSDVYGSTAAVWPDDVSGKKRLLLSVGGKLYLFSDLDKDGLTFRTRTPLNLPAQRNRHKGWQEIAVKAPFKVQHIRIGNDRNGMGNYRDSMLHVVTFEAISGGKNVATLDRIAKVKTETPEPQPWVQVQRPELMFTPGNKPRDDQPGFSSWGYYTHPAVISLKEPVSIEKIRFLLSDREQGWYDRFLPFYWQGNLHRHAQEQGEPWYQYKVEVSADLKTWVTVADAMRTEMYHSTPALVDWDKDGKVDLVLGIMNSQGNWGGDKEYRLYRNTGTNDDPRFSSHEPFKDADGKPIKLPAYYYECYQSGVSVCDLDRDGKLDLVIEGYRNSELLYYRNISTAPNDLRLQKVKALGDPPIRYRSRMRFFCIGDVDGDGVLDILDSVNTEGGSNGACFFKGMPSGAPPRVLDLAVTKSAQDGIDVTWTAPPGATSFDIRWSTREEPSELNWLSLRGITGDYAAAKPAKEGSAPPPQSARLTGLPAGQQVFIALKSRSAKGELSAISEPIEAVSAPLRRLVLRNGPAGANGMPAYKGCEGTYLDAQKPAEPDPRKPSFLWARAPVPIPNRPFEFSDKQKVALLRFKDMPISGTVERATLELSTDPLLQTDGSLLQGLATLAVSVNSIRDDWDAASATWAAPAPGKAWTPQELDAGGTFLSMAKPQFTIRERRRLTWDVTEAVRSAQKAGRNAISLLLRVDYTGHYIAGQGYKLCGPDWPAPALRPRLCLITR